MGNRKFNLKPLRDNCITYFILLNVGIVAAVAAYVWLLHSDAKREANDQIIANHLSQKGSYLKTTTSIDSLCDYIYGELQSTPELTATIRRIGSAPTKELANAQREHLYKLAAPIYSRAKDANIGSMHFHSSESQSVLRMHKPATFGDSLKEYRQQVVATNEKHQRNATFEEGKYSSGYRIIYPLFDNKIHVGSVELVHDSAALLNSLAQNHPSQLFAYLISKDHLKEVEDPDLISRYEDSVFSDQYYERNDGLSKSFISTNPDYKEQGPLLDTLETAFNEAISSTDTIGTTSFDHGGTDYIMTIIRTLDSTSGKEAVIVGVEPNQVLGSIRNDTKKESIVAILISIFVLTAIWYHYYRWSNKISETIRVTNQLKLFANEVPGMVFQFQLASETDKFSFPFVSGGVKDLYGFSSEELIQNSDLFFNSLYPADKEVVIASIKESARTMEEWYCEYRILFENGRVEWMEGHSSPQALPDGSVLWHGYIKNVSNRKKYEILLHDAREQAERAEKTKSQLLATMSHDIRTQMNAIIGLSGLLQSTELDAEQSEFVGTLMDSSNMLLHLLSDMLDYSKIEAEKLVIVKEEFKLADMINTVSGIGNSLARPHSVKVLSEEVGPLPKICIGDESRISQVLLNLISNAVKFSKEKGQVDFRISAPQSDEDNHTRIKFEVIDHGTGISPEAVNKIFEPYVQAEDTISTQRKGTGLGLSISSKLSDLMDGELICKSEQGSGSQFIFTISLQTIGEMQELEPPQVDKQASDFTNFNLEVLIVDDHPINLKIAVYILSKMGIEADTSCNGQEALSACLGKRYDLVFMDLQMPVMDGIKATQAILAQVPETRRPSIVALTANISSAQRKKCMEIGMDDYLTKPVKKQQIQDVIEKTIESKQKLEDSKTISA